MERICSLALAGEGADIVIADYVPEAAEAVRRKSERSGDRAVAAKGMSQPV